MPKTATKTKLTKKETIKTPKEQPSVYLNSYLQNEIARLAEMYTVSTLVFEEFADFVIENYKKKESTTKHSNVKQLPLPQI